MMTDQEYRDRARELYQRDGEIEIDDPEKLIAPGEKATVGGAVSRSAGGAYVQAWVWVAADDPA